MKRSILILLLALVLLACSADESGKIEVDGIWGRVSPGAATNGAFYMQVANHKRQDDALVAVRTAACEAVELHESRMDDNGVMRMGPVEGGRIPLPAGKMVELRPGGMHVMCIGLNRPLAEGNTIPLTLVFAAAEEMRVEAEIRTEAP